MDMRQKKGLHCPRSGSRRNCCCLRSRPATRAQQAGATTAALVSERCATRPAKDGYDFRPQQKKSDDREQRPIGNADQKAARAGAGWAAIGDSTASHPRMSQKGSIGRESHHRLDLVAGFEFQSADRERALEALLETELLHHGSLFQARLFCACP